MLQKHLTISANARSLLPFIDEVFRQGLVSQISNWQQMMIMLI